MRRFIIVYIVKLHSNLIVNFGFNGLICYCNLIFVAEDGDIPNSCQALMKTDLNCHTTNTFHASLGYQKP